MSLVVWLFAILNVIILSANAQLKVLNVTIGRLLLRGVDDGGPDKVRVLSPEAKRTDFD